jgi:hypothetical protein
MTESTQQDAATAVAPEMHVRAYLHAVRFLHAAAAELPRLAGALREQELEETRAGLAHLLDGVGSLARLATEEAWPADSSPRDELPALGETLRELVGHQERADWPALADLLEHRLVGHLERWRAPFERRLTRLAAEWEQAQGS